MTRPVFAAAAIAATLALAAPAAAECLTDADLTRGIVARFENGDTTLMRRMNDGYLTIREEYSDGSTPMLFRAHRGIYFVEEGEAATGGGFAPGSELQVIFKTDPALLPDPLPGITWEGPTTNVFADGATRDETVTIRYSDAPPLDLSGCSYEAVRAHIRYDWGDEGGMELSYLYLPEVTTAVITSNHFDGEPPNTTIPVALERYSK
ncbi:hypothetical protein [Pseudoroseicyclus tamaricis]|uniref:Group 4 capsule polysaccharide lipoprotein GfcB/YjbF n=1 Tax=Pseudoroseicyclus tamaricis TaxID=2705421 RepID=A0A6B2JRW1_9RHOB|nr:hypothetical protein [Pseudoroseicyclus tamaricis]NDV00725.1 hypothetical protein [Pseudoroseicyclus tamaricis]